jgi:predicted RNA binding protein YcfA (HicA-like mRNA interferase family)
MVKVSGKRDVQQLIKKAAAQGFEVNPTKSGHWLVKKDGARVTTLPGTPSDRRSLLNCISHMKRHGFIP